MCQTVTSLSVKVGCGRADDVDEFKDIGTNSCAGLTNLLMCDSYLDLDPKSLGGNIFGLII